MWVPIPFERSFRMAYSRTRYGTGYCIYHQYVGGANLSQPIRAWDGKTPPDDRVLQLINRAGTNIAPRPDTEEGRKKGVRQESGSVTVPKDGSVTLLKLAKAPSMIRALELSAPEARLRLPQSLSISPKPPTAVSAKTNSSSRVI